MLFKRGVMKNCKLPRDRTKFLLHFKLLFVVAVDEILDFLRRGLLLIYFFRLVDLIFIINTTIIIKEKKNKFLCMRNHIKNYIFVYVPIFTNNQHLLLQNDISKLISRLLCSWTKSNMKKYLCVCANGALSRYIH